MGLDSSINRLITWVSDHKATLCSAGACAGVFATAYFSGKAAVRVHTTVDPDLDKKEKVKEYVKAYWKTGLAAGVTCGLIISSDRIHIGKEAAIAGVAAIWKQKAVDIDKKLINEVGEERAHEIHNEIIQEKIKDDKKNHPEKFPEEEIIDNLPDGSMTAKLLVYEPYTDQYFYTTRETIAWVMLEANRRLMQNFDVRLNYIIKMLGGIPKPEGDLIGWNWENEVQEYSWSYFGGPWIELVPDVRKDKKGALCLFYQVDPETQEPDDMIYKESV